MVDLHERQVLFFRVALLQGASEGRARWAGRIIVLQWVSRIVVGVRVRITSEGAREGCRVGIVVGGGFVLVFARADQPGYHA